MIRVSLFLCAALVVRVTSAQSLVEVAKKEKERRESLRHRKVYREEDLTATAGKNASVTGAESTDEAPDLSDEGREERSRSGDSDWDEVFRSCRLRFERAKVARGEAIELFVSGLPIRTDGGRISCSTILACQLFPVYVRHALTCESLQEDIEKQDALMKEIQDECLNEARKRGVLPGEARLQ